MGLKPNARCRRCSKELPTTDGRRMYCGPCGKLQRNDALARHATAHRDSISESKAAWKRRNIEHTRAARRATKARRVWENRAEVRARRARNLGCIVIPFTAEQLRARLAYYAYRCWVCGEPADNLDHVKPLSKGGAHALCNIRPACSWCNAHKRNLWPLPRFFRAKLLAGVA